MRNRASVILAIASLGVSVIDPAPTPEPATVILVGLGLAGVLRSRRGILR
jgi:hypothetical protein